MHGSGDQGSLCGLGDISGSLKTRSMPREMQSGRHFVCMSKNMRKDRMGWD